MATSKKKIPKPIQDFANQITKELGQYMSSNSRLVYHDTIVSILSNTKIDKRTLSSTTATKVISDVVAEITERNQREISRLIKKRWLPYEKNTIEYLANTPSFQHSEVLHKGRPNYNLITDAINSIYYNGRKVRTLNSIQMKYFMIKGRKRKEKRSLTQNKRETILRQKIHDEKLESKLIKYLMNYPEFQNKSKKPKITKLTEALNYIFYDNSNVRTTSYVKNILLKST